MLEGRDCPNGINAGIGEIKHWDAVFSLKARVHLRRSREALVISPPPHAALNRHHLCDRRPPVADVDGRVSHAIADNLPALALHNSLRNHPGLHFNPFVNPGSPVPFAVLDQRTPREFIPARDAPSSVSHNIPTD